MYVSGANVRSLDSNTQSVAGPGTLHATGGHAGYLSGCSGNGDPPSTYKTRPAPAGFPSPLYPDAPWACKKARRSRERFFAGTHRSEQQGHRTWNAHHPRPTYL